MSQQQSLSSFDAQERIEDKETDDETSLRQYEGADDADIQGSTAVALNI